MLWLSLEDSCVFGQENPKIPGTLWNGFRGCHKKVLVQGSCLCLFPAYGTGLRKNDLKWTAVWEAGSRLMPWPRVIARWEKNILSFLIPRRAEKLWCLGGPGLDLEGHILVTRPAQSKRAFGLGQATPAGGTLSPERNWRPKRKFTRVECCSVRSEFSESRKLTKGKKHDQAEGFKTNAVGIQN